MGRNESHGGSCGKIKKERAHNGSDKPQYPINPRARFCMQTKSLLIAAVVLALTIAGCSESKLNSPLTPTEDRGAVSSRSILGLFQVVANPDVGTLEFTPVRSATMHVNVLKFMEIPGSIKIKVSNIVFNGKISRLRTSASLIRSQD